MKNSTKVILITAIVLVMAVVAYMADHLNSGNVATISPAGTIGTSGKYYSQTMSLATAAGTTTSMFNNSGYDFAIRATDVMCQVVGTSKTAYTGAGLASLVVRTATSSTNAITLNVADVNTNYAAVDTIGTSTPDSYNATSTEGIITGTSRIWPNQTYLLISSNATNTAACAVGVSVMPL